MTHDNSRSPLHIAIIEDHPVHRQAFTSMIQMDAAAHRVESFETARDFLRLKHRIGQFDCLLMDVMLPDESGFVLASMIRHLHPHLPIIFITAYASDSEAQRALTEGADDYLPKSDYTPLLLMRSIRYAIERRRFLRQQHSLAEQVDHYRGLLAQQREFVAIISHEFCTPLAIIQSSAQLAEMNASKNNQETLHLSRIQQAATRLEKLVNRALCYSQIEDGTLYYRPLPVNLAQWW